MTFLKMVTGIIGGFVLFAVGVAVGVSHKTTDHLSPATTITLNEKLPRATIRGCGSEDSWDIDYKGAERNEVIITCIVP